MPTLHYGQDATGSGLATPCLEPPFAHLGGMVIPDYLRAALVQLAATNVLPSVKAGAAPSYGTPDLRGLDAFQREVSCWLVDAGRLQKAMRLHALVADLRTAIGAATTAGSPVRLVAQQALAKADERMQEWITQYRQTVYDVVAWRQGRPPSMGAMEWNWDIESADHGDTWLWGAIVWKKPNPELIQRWYRERLGAMDARLTAIDDILATVPAPTQKPIAPTATPSLPPYLSIPSEESPPVGPPADPGTGIPPGEPGWTPQPIPDAPDAPSMPQPRFGPRAPEAPKISPSLLVGGLVAVGAIWWWSRRGRRVESSPEIFRL